MLQKFAIALFKINQIKKERKKKRKKNEKRAIYNNIFELVLIQFMTEYQRVKKEQKTNKILIKKETINSQRMDVVVKKQIIANNIIKRLAARVVKKTQKKEKIPLKAFERRCNRMKKKMKMKKTDMSFAF